MHLSPHHSTGKPLGILLFNIFCIKPVSLQNLPPSGNSLPPCLMAVRIPFLELCQAVGAAAREQSSSSSFSQLGSDMAGRQDASLCSDRRPSVHGGRAPRVAVRAGVSRLPSSTVYSACRSVRACRDLRIGPGSACAFLASPLGSLINRGPASCMRWACPQRQWESLGKYRRWSSLAPRFPWQPPE